MHRLATLLFLVVLTLNALAQLSLAPLANYVGLYEYENNTRIDMISGKDLFAVLDEAKYKLPRIGEDTFVNGAGQPVTFRRDAGGSILGFEEHGHFYRRLSSVPSATRAISPTLAPMAISAISTRSRLIAMTESPSVTSHSLISALTLPRRLRKGFWARHGTTSTAFCFTSMATWFTRSTSTDMTGSIRISFVLPRSRLSPPLQGSLSTSTLFRA